MSAVASLGMYDMPWLQAANDEIWEALRRRLGEPSAPPALERKRDLEEIWRDPALLLAQTCGLPLLTSLAGRVRLVATPCYDLPGCDGPRYCSFVLTAADLPAKGIAGFRGARAAVNAACSQSGMNALRALVAPLGPGRFFREALISGGHRQSIAMIREGRADIAAIDCVTHGLLAAHAPAELAGTRVLCRTASTPGLPLITAATASDDLVARLRAALDAVIADPALAGARARLHLYGMARLTLADYAPILALPGSGAAL